MAPKMAAHSDNINLNPALFARIDSLYNERNNLGLTPEAVRLVEVCHPKKSSLLSIVKTNLLASLKVTSPRPQTMLKPQTTMANYYAYMWSEILAADAFAYVQTQGGLNRDIGMKYRPF